MDASRTRVIVVNFAPEARGLTAAVADFFGRDTVELVCVGATRRAEAEAALARAASEGLQVRYLEGSVDEGVDRFAARLAEAAEIAEAAAVIVLPVSGSAEVDAHSRLTCVAIQRACGERPLPTTVVAIEDPEASVEFSGLGVTTIFYPGFLRAALFAHACVDLPVFNFILGLLRGRFRVETLTIPEHLRGRTFGDACMTLERDAAGRPLTLVGVFADDPEADGATAMRINPGARFPLSKAASLLALTERA